MSAATKPALAASSPPRPTEESSKVPAAETGVATSATSTGNAVEASARMECRRTLVIVTQPTPPPLPSTPPQPTHPARPPTNPPTHPTTHRTSPRILPTIIAQRNSLRYRPQERFRSDKTPLPLPPLPLPPSLIPHPNLHLPFLLPPHPFPLPYRPTTAPRQPPAASLPILRNLKPTFLNPPTPQSLSKTRPAHRPTLRCRPQNQAPTSR